MLQVFLGLTPDRRFRGYPRPRRRGCSWSRRRTGERRWQRPELWQRRVARCLKRSAKNDVIIFIPFVSGI